MRNLIALIGTSDTYQFGGAMRTEFQNSAFSNLIEQTCNTHHIRCIAEEMSHDALRLRNRSQSTVSRIACNLGLHHIYCDPSESEQSAMGIHIERNAPALKGYSGWSDQRITAGIAAEHRQREQYWLQKLMKNTSWPCLFVCGSNHVSHFHSLLQHSGFQVKLIADDWNA